MIKRSIQEEDLTFINTYGPNIGTSKYIKQTLTDKNRKKWQQYNNNMGILRHIFNPVYIQQTDHPDRNQ